jgi:hypothetical protein
MGPLARSEAVCQGALKVGVCRAAGQARKDYQPGLRSGGPSPNTARLLRPLSR